MGQPKITLYVDVVSPFAYEAFHILQNEPAFQHVEVTYVPIFLGGLMKLCGNTPPIYIKNKDKWVQTERVRWARAFHVPMAEASPPSFPPPMLIVNRVLCAMLADQGEKGQELLVKALAKLWHAFWVEHDDVTKSEVLEPILAQVLGQELAEKYIAEASTRGKEVLLKNTDQAFADEAFGLPWFVVTNSSGQQERFWGVDHVGQVAHFLGIDKPTQGGWKAVL